MEIAWVVGIVVMLLFFLPEIADKLFGYDVEPVWEEIMKDLAIWVVGIIVVCYVINLLTGI